MSKVQRFIKKKKKLKGKQDILATGEKRGQKSTIRFECRPEENGNGAQSFTELLDAVSHTFSLPWPIRPFPS